MRDARIAAPPQPSRDGRSQVYYDRDRHLRSYYRPESHQSHHHLSPRFNHTDMRGNPRWVETGRRVSPSVRTRSREEDPAIRHRTEGNLALQERDQTSGGIGKETVHGEAIETAREEIREYLTQYANCADPSEIAARRERIILAEEKGETEELARNMVANAVNLLPVTEQETIMEAEQNQIRKSALHRLGNQNEPICEVPPSEEAQIPVKKRLGRSPLNKTQIKSLGVNKTTSTAKKRRVAPVRISPKRKSAPSSSTRGTNAPWVISSIWTARNFRIFQKRIFTAQKVMTKAIVDAKEWKQAQTKDVPPTPNLGKIFKPTGQEVICHSDAAWDKDRNASGLGWSFSENQNERFISHRGLAVRSAMEHAIALQFRKVIFETDSLQLVAAIVEQAGISDLHGILADIYLLSSQFDSANFRYVNRSSLF
ncbi:hypothetical protein IGI04_025715 [Brassica rapa subsp. trilocularis]|uniref:RNase H type-1 domain-containing protein n=1 Tax=Brassica rapa subsp. trilocularis TaxID=1813537 RepID=A0ABQ7KTV3_BRACM|nr:hypothetical protein IGI04_025715 [Brassica rapa subsp. trilocularis]